MLIGTTNKITFKMPTKLYNPMITEQVITSKKLWYAINKNAKNDEYIERVKTNIIKNIKTNSISLSKKIDTPLLVPAIKSNICLSLGFKIELKLTSLFMAKKPKIIPIATKRSNRQIMPLLLLRVEDISSPKLMKNLFILNYMKISQI